MKIAEKRGPEQGFTLIEIIVTIVIAAIAGAMLTVITGNSMTQSAQPLFNIQRNNDLLEVAEEITTEYRKSMEDGDTVAEFIGKVNAESYGDVSVSTFQTGFSLSGNTYSESGSGATYYRVVLSNGVQSVTILFTD